MNENEKVLAHEIEIAVGVHHALCSEHSRLFDEGNWNDMRVVGLLVERWFKIWQGLSESYTHRLTISN